jgi:diguanylate cyclase (GGDEF)-like protein
LNRALRTLSAGNRTLLRERNEQELLNAMCKVAVEQGGYRAAYVCYARHDEAKSIDVKATAGADRGFLTSVNMTWEDNERGRGSVGRCLRSGERVILRSILRDRAAAPWHAAAREHGFHSIISLPLRVQGALIGTFTLAAGEDAFDENEVALLDEMAADLSFGIQTIRNDVRRREAEDIARRALTEDPVVRLPSRLAFVRRVGECVSRGRANHEPVAVLDVHFGRLQDVFDSFGYEHGNAVLRQIAARLRGIAGWEDDIGRLPVDDFGLVLCSQDADDASRSAQRLREALDAPVRIGDALVDLQFSIGVSFYPGHGEDAEVLVRRASIAAREAFRRELPYSVYGGATARENPARLALAADLRSAIETRGLMLHYQPKVRLADGVQTGGEALLRWNHPSRGMVPPSEFVALAEDIGQIRALTNEVIDLAVRQQHAWGAAALPLAINLSVRNLLDPALGRSIDGLLGTWGVPPELLHFEITESALMDDPEAARRVLAELRDRGAKIYIDDFGTGYSSLSYLVRLPVHALKIDRSFVQQMSKSDRAAGLVASVISMAHSLGVAVVAEGVENEADAAMLRKMGCDEAQGYYFAKPLAAEDYAKWKKPV